MGIAKVTSTDLGVLAGLLESEKVRPAIERRYPLEESSEAARYLLEGHAKGKIVVTVDRA